MQHHRFPLVLLTLACFLLMGCATDTSRVGRGGAQGQLDTVVQPEPAYDVGYLLGWAHDLDMPQGSRITSATLLDDLLITIEQPSNMISAIQVRDGKVRWRRIIGQPTDQFFAPVRYGDELLLPSERQLFSLRVEDGGIANLAQIDEVVLSSPVLVNDTAIFGTASGKLLAHDVRTGFTNWAYGLQSRIVAAPSLVGVNVFAADNSGDYVLLDARDGALLWRKYVFGPVVTSATVDRLNIYVPSLDRSLYALDRVTGQDRWVYRSQQPLKQSPASIELSVYQPVPNVGLVSLSSRDGAVQWTLDEPARALKLQREGVVLAYSDNKLMTVDTEDGRVLREAPTLPLHQAFEGPDGSVILVTQGGRLLRLNPRP